MHVCEESLEKINAKDIELFQHGPVHEFYRFESVDYFGTSEYFSGLKK